MEKWLILLGIIGLIFFLIKRGGVGMGCCGGGHSHGNRSENSEEKIKDNPKQLANRKKDIS